MTDQPKLMTPEERVAASVTTSFGAAALMIKADRKDILAAVGRLPSFYDPTTDEVFADAVSRGDLTNLLEGR